MALTVKHVFHSEKGDGSDATLVRPSNWNANHDIELASNRIIGRLTAGPGDAEELPVTSYMIGLLNTADYAALAALLGLPTTGDARLTYKPAPDAGWIFANDGTIGDVGSGSTVASLATKALFTLFYDTMEYACPLLTSGGGATTRAAQGTATAAFNAKCRMVIPKTLGRALITGGGTGVGLSARYAGQIGGEETHQITLGEMPSHGHTGTPTGGISVVDINHTHNQQGSFTSGDPNLNHSHSQQGSFASGGSGYTFDHTHGISGCTNVSTTGGGGFATGFAQAQNTGSSSVANFDHTHTTTISGQTGTVSSWHTHVTTLSGTTNYMNQNNTHNHTFTGDLMTTASMGSSLAHNNMQPWTAWNVMIRL